MLIRLHKDLLNDDNGFLRTPESGFSLPQLILAVLILGILSSLAFSKWTQFSRKQALLGEGKAMLGFMEEARSYGIKKNKQVGVQFEAGGRGYRLFVDENANGQLDDGESIRNLKLADDLAFGLPAEAPTKGPQSLAVNANGLVGAWAMAWIAPLNLSQTPSQGAIYLRQNELSAFTLCIYGTAKSQKCAASLWDGNTWVAL